MKSSTDESGVVTFEYGARHLNPKNLSPLKRRLEKQLKSLKDVNEKAPALQGPYEHKTGSRFLHTFLVSR